MRWVWEKTIQAIAACALLHRLGKARRVLVVTPASLKTEWEEQICRFTHLSYQIVFGRKMLRLRAYTTLSNSGDGSAGSTGSCSRTGPTEGTPVDDSTPFFTIVNYEQMVADALDVNERLAPDSSCWTKPSESRTGAPRRLRR